MLVVRQAPVNVRGTLAALAEPSEDERIDELFASNLKLYSSREASDRELALEKLWDALERFKTLHGPNKKSSIESLLAAHRRGGVRCTGQRGDGGADQDRQRLPDSALRSQPTSAAAGHGRLLVWANERAAGVSADPERVAPSRAHPRQPGCAPRRRGCLEGGKATRRHRLPPACKSAAIGRAALSGAQRPWWGGVTQSSRMQWSSTLAVRHTA